MCRFGSLVELCEKEWESHPKKELPLQALGLLFLPLVVTRLIVLASGIGLERARTLRPFVLASILVALAFIRFCHCRTPLQPKHYVHSGIVGC